MQDFYGKSYHLYVDKWYTSETQFDKWYTSETQFDHLEQNGTSACGTARLNWLRVPPLLKRQEMKKGDHAFHQNENLLMVEIWSNGANF